MDHEDAEVERPAIGSILEKAITFAHGRVEAREGKLATIFQVVSQGRKLPKYLAIVGAAEVIELVSPTHVDISDEDKELRRLIVGDTVKVREKEETTFSGVRVSWVMVKRVHLEGPEGAPTMWGRVHRVEQEMREASVTGANGLVPIHIVSCDLTPPGCGEKSVTTECKVGVEFYFVPKFDGNGDLLPIEWEEVDIQEEDSDEERATEGTGSLLSGEDLAEGFHFAGTAVTELVRRLYDVVGDLTVGGYLAHLPLQGGRAFLEGLAKQTRKGYKWGEMVMAAAMKHVLQCREAELASGERQSDKKGSWEGKAVREMSAGEEKELELAREMATQEEYNLEAWAQAYVSQEVEGKAFFFNPTPDHLPTFAKWLGTQMREGNRKAMPRRAIVAVDVLAESTPWNLQNIQRIDILTADHVWKPKSLTLVEDHVVHMEIDNVDMVTVPVEKRMGKKMLLVEFDSLFVADKRPMPTVVQIAARPGCYGDINRVDVCREGLALEPTPHVYEVMMPRCHPSRQWIRNFIRESRPSCYPGGEAEAWVVQFPDEETGKHWEEINSKRTGDLRLFTSPMDEFRGGEKVMNIRTKSFVGAEELGFLLQADWIQLVGHYDGNYEYRFSTPALMRDLGEYLYDLNRMRTEGKRKQGKLLNTFVRLSNDEGKAMHVKAERKGMRTVPYIQNIRAEGGRVLMSGRREGGKWFSIWVGRASRAGVLQWLQEMSVQPRRQGVVVHSGGATVWICVDDEEMVETLQDQTVHVFPDRLPWVVRLRKGPPVAMEPLEEGKVGAEGRNSQEGQNEEAGTPTKFSEVTKKMVGQLMKTRGFTNQDGRGGTPERIHPLGRWTWESMGHPRPRSLRGALL